MPVAWQPAFLRLTCMQGPNPGRPAPTAVSRPRHRIGAHVARRRYVFSDTAAFRGWHGHACVAMDADARKA